jgi:hypothetical protein
MVLPILSERRTNPFKIIKAQYYGFKEQDGIYGLKNYINITSCLYIH